MSSCSASSGHFAFLPSSVKSPNSDQLQIRAFCLRLSLTSTTGLAPRLLKLVYVPLEESDTDISPVTPVVLPLHRVWNPERDNAGDNVYASTDLVTGYGHGEGIRFQAFLGEERAAEGVIQRNGEGSWVMQCWLAAAVVEVRAVSEGVDLRSTSIRGPTPRGRRRRKSPFVSMLQPIPEEVEGDPLTAVVGGNDYGRDGQATSKAGCGGGDRCLTGHYWDDDQGGPWKTGSSQELRWAVDMAVWAGCVGVGLLLSRATTKSIRKGFFLL